MPAIRIRPTESKMSDQAQEDLQFVMSSFGKVVRVQAIGGGCISDAMRVDVVDSAAKEKTFFVKANGLHFLDNFQCEAAGLRALDATKTIRVPSVIDVSASRGKAWLVLEFIAQGNRDKQYFRRFGDQLARMHQASVGDAFGWEADNYLGAAKQPNQSVDSWDAFFAQNRIGYQLRWAIDQGIADSELKSDCQRIITAMPELLRGREQQTVLLHGDLWSGNYLCDESGQSVLIDPAVYRGCREAEFGMLKLFGGCPQEFYDAYQEAWPLPSGWQRRVNVYVLYHLLNHLNLFGTGYASQCGSMAKQILK